MRFPSRHARVVVALAVTGVMAGAALPARASTVAVADPAGDATCAPTTARS